MKVNFENSWAPPVSNLGSGLVYWVSSSRTEEGNKAHVYPPTHILSDQGDLLVVRPGSRTQVNGTEGEKPDHCCTYQTHEKLVLHKGVS